MIVARCRQCDKAYRAADDQAGRRLRCKACGGVVTVPGGRPTASTPVPKPRLTPPPPPFVDLPVDEPLPLPPGGTGASHPARAAVDWAQYFWCYPGVPLLVLICGLVGLVGAIASGQWWAVPACMLGGAVRAVRFVPRLRLMARRFLIGNVNPAVVLAADRGPWRVAVLTDLATRRGVEAPAIRIMTAPLGRMAGGPPRAGMRLAAPSLYGGRLGDGADRWANFAPVIANCCIRSPATLNRLLRLIPEADWRELDDRLTDLPDRRLGLHRLWPGGRPTYDSTTAGPIARGGLAAAVALILVGLVAVSAVRLGYVRRADAPPEGPGVATPNLPLTTPPAPSLLPRSPPPFVTPGGDRSIRVPSPPPPLPRLSMPDPFETARRLRETMAGAATRRARPGAR